MTSTASSSSSSDGFNSNGDVSDSFLCDLERNHPVVFSMLEEYRRALQESDACIACLTESIASLEQERYDIAKTKQAEIEELEDSIIHLDSECETAKESLREKHTECEVLSAKVEDLCRAIESSDMARAECEASLHARITLLEKHNADLKIEVEDMSARYRDLQRQCDTNAMQLERAVLTNHGIARDQTKLSPSKGAVNSVPRGQRGSPVGVVRRRNSTGGPRSSTAVRREEDSSATEWKITLGIDPSEVKISQVDPLSPRPAWEACSVLSGTRREVADTHPYYPHHPSASSLWQSSVLTGSALVGLSGSGTAGGAIKKSMTGGRALSPQADSKRRDGDQSHTVGGIDDFENTDHPVTVAVNRRANIARSCSESKFAQPKSPKNSKNKGMGMGKGMGMKVALTKKAHPSGTSQHWLHRLHPSSVVPISFPDEDFESSQPTSNGFRRSQSQTPHDNHHNMATALSAYKEGSKGLLNFDSVVGSMSGGSRTNGYKTIDHLHLTNISIE